MRYALTDDAGLIKNIIVVEDTDLYDVPPHRKLVYDPNGKARIGDTYANGIFTPPEEAPVPIIVPASISDRQFFQQLAVENVITQDEALAAVATGTIPAAMIALVDALPQEAQFNAKMLLSGTVTFLRNHPLTAVFGQAFGWTDAQIDQFWIDASKL